MMEDAISKDDNGDGADLFGYNAIRYGQLLTASVIYEKALSKSKSLQDNTSMAESYRKQGQLLRKKKDYPGSMAKFSEALSMSTLMNDKSSMAKTLNSMAILNWRTKRKMGTKKLVVCPCYCRRIGDKPKISKYLNNIGIWYRDDSDYSKSVEYYQRSLEIKALGDVRTLAKH